LQVSRRRINAPAGGRSIKLFPIGDPHLGAAACDIEHFRRTVDMVKCDPDAYWLGIGDYGDLIMPSDPRWAMGALDWKRLGYTSGRPSVSNLGVEARDMIRRELEPIAGKCLGLHFGNHEQAFSRHYYVDVVRYLCAEWEVPFLGYTALTRLDIAIKASARDHGRVWSPIVFSEHGAAGGGTDGNALNSLQKRAAEFRADVFLKGHVHKFGVSTKTELGWGRDKIAYRDRVFMLTGTYLKGYTEAETTYGEYKAYPPNEIGGGVVIFEPATERIHGTSTAALAAVA
jgi:hypothetical protein